MAKTAAQRKADQRIRDALRQIEMGAEDVTITMYRSTQAELEFIKEAGGFEESEEAITVLIHNAAAIIKRDSHEKNDLLKLPNSTS